MNLQDDNLTSHDMKKLSNIEEDDFNETQEEMECYQSTDREESMKKMNDLIVLS